MVSNQKTVKSKIFIRFLDNLLTCRLLEVIIYTGGDICE